MTLTTCLWFNGNARQAAEFYTKIFPNSELINHWATEVDTPGNQAGDEVVVNFKIFGQDFIALNGGPQFPHTEAISFQIPCNSQEEVDEYWDLLTADGGSEGQCGWLKDKFGVSWQVIPTEMLQYLGGSNREGSKRATTAIQEMKKIILLDIKNAYLNSK